MSRNFNAACVSVEEDSDLWLVGFADAEFNTRHYVLLQREKSPQPDNIALGLDGYHVEVDDQGKCWNGGIKHFELFPDRAVIEFADETLPIFGDKRQIVVGFTLRQKQLDELRDCLAKIFAGYDCFVDHSA